MAEEPTVLPDPLPEEVLVEIEALANERVGGCFSAFWKMWDKISPDPWVVQVIREGYQIPFRELPPLSPRPIAFQTYHPSTPQFQALDQEISQMLEKGAIEVPPEPLISGYYARIFVVPKGD